MTYQSLSEQNKYLYAQMEHCSLMMGLALLNHQEVQYNEFKAVRDEIKQRIDINLDRIEEIWNTAVSDRPANRRPVGVRFEKEWRIIKSITYRPRQTVTELSKRFNVTEVSIKKIIKNNNLALK